MKTTIALLAFLALLGGGTISSRAEPSDALIKFWNGSEDDAAIKIDGKLVCTIKEQRDCTARVSPGVHMFEIFWFETVSPSFRASGSVSIGAGDSKLLCADTDGAGWEDPSNGCADYAGLLKRDFKVQAVPHN